MHKKIFPMSVVLSATLIIGFLFGPALIDTAKICWNDDDYSHGLLLPFVTVYLFWERKAKLRASLTEVERTNVALIAVAGLATIVLTSGLFLRLLGTSSGLLFASWLGFFPTILGTLTLMFGLRFSRLCFLPIALNFMAKPLPDSLVPRLFNPLQVLAAQVSGRVLEAFDVPVHLVGNIIEIPGMRLLVEEACSGMRSVMALLTVALVVISLTPRSLFRQIILILVSVGIAVFLNIVRVALTGILAHFYDPAAATGFFHGFSGLVVFVLGLGLLFTINIGLDHIPRLPKSSGTTARGFLCH